MQNDAAVHATVPYGSTRSGDRNAMNYVQDTLVGRKPTRAMKRLPPSSGIEIAAGIGDAPQVVPRREHGKKKMN